MSSATDPRPRVSVEYLVRQWNGSVGAPEQWYLGLVQRDELWKPGQRVDLLDSLLKAFPIGSILLGRSGDASETTTVFVKDGAGRRSEATVTADTWQILDGQQRMSALAAIFSRDERAPQDDRGHMELDMTDPAGAIYWVGAHDSKPPKPEGRSQRVDLSAWAAFMDRHEGDELDGPGATDEDLRRLLAELDSDFTTELSGARAVTARSRWADLLSLWTEERIPVLAAPVRSPEQLLEVFTRVNLGGTAISQTDIYYAAVKTFWPEAESSLQRIVDRVDGLLDRFAVLELASRLARVAFGAADPINVDVAILNGPPGRVLRRALTEMCAVDSEFLVRLEATARWMVESSRLGWGLHLLHRRSIATVLAWSIASPTSDRRQLLEDNAADIDAFLAGTDLLGYRSRLRRDRFDRVAFREAVAAGEQGRTFPGLQIREVLRVDEGEDGLARIELFDTSAERRATGNRHGSLILSVVQKWAFHSGDLHLDHIYASEASKQDMVVDGPFGRKRTHPDRSDTVNSLGNLWLLPAVTNEALGAERPAVKFHNLHKWLAAKDPEHPVPPTDLWTIDPEKDEDKFVSVERMLKDSGDNADIDASMTAFRNLVESRADRLISQFVQLVPGCVEFARASVGTGAEPSAVSRDFADGLNLGQLRLDYEAEGNPLPSVAVGSPLPASWSGPWAGRENLVRRIWQEVSERTKEGDLNPKQDGTYAHGQGFAFRRFTRVTRTWWAWFGARLQVGETDPSPLVLMFSDVPTSFRMALLESSLDEWVPASPDADIWIPVPLDPSVPERRAVETVLEFFDQLDIILEAKAPTAG